MPCLRRYFDSLTTRGNECGHGAAALQLGLHMDSCTEEGWNLIPKPPLRRPRLSGHCCDLGCRGYSAQPCHQGGGDHLHADHTCTLQWSLDESMQALEHEAIEKERWDHQSFLEACGVGFTSLSHRSLGDTHVPLAVANGECVLSHPFGCYHPNWLLQLG